MKVKIYENNGEFLGAYANLDVIRNIEGIRDIYTCDDNDTLQDGWVYLKENSELVCTRATFERMQAH